MNLESGLNNVSLWGAIKTLEDFPFFKDNPPSKLDNMQKIKYGDRTMFNKMIGKTVEDLAQSIVMEYSNYWKKLIYIDDSNIDINYSSSRNLEETILDDENRKSSKTDLNKVSAFNTETLIDDTGFNSDNEDNYVGKKVRTLTDSNLSLNTAYQNLSLIQKNNIINVVLKDVSNHLTLDIY